MHLSQLFPLFRPSLLSCNIMTLAVFSFAFVQRPFCVLRLCRLRHLQYRKLVLSETRVYCHRRREDSRTIKLSNTGSGGETFFTVWINTLHLMRYFLLTQISFYFTIPNFRSSVDCFGGEAGGINSSKTRRYFSVSGEPNFFTLKMEAACFSKTVICTDTTT